MNIFKYLNNILHSKKLESKDTIEYEQDYQPYLINRWVSMYSPDMCTIINHTANNLHTILTNKLTHYKFLHNILPRCKFKRISYIKKQPKQSENETYSMIASGVELSVREIKSYCNQLGIDTSKYDNTKHSKH